MSTGRPVLRVDFSSEAVLGDAAHAAYAAEQAGFDGMWFGETAHDPFVSIAIAAPVTTRLELGSGVAIAFARSPMTVAVTANDVHLVSQGRLLLGLGSQVKPHITRRFSMPWSSPAPRMREFILAMRAIWRSWNTDETLDFRGDFYSHTLMTPFFNPGPNPYGTPRVLLAGVGAHMTEVAGEVADGFMCHGFATERYLREVTLPALELGRKRAGTDLTGFQVSGLPFVVTGETEEEFTAAANGVREQIAFYASTPSYRSVLELHGWGDLQNELNALSRTGRWSEMGALIDDDILGTFAVVAEPAEVAERIRLRFGDIFTRLHLYLKAPLKDEILHGIVADLKHGQRTSIS